MEQITLLHTIQVTMLIVLLMVFHELGHIFSAKIMGLAIQKVSFQCKPYPHFFVAITWPTKKIKRLIYLFSGSLFTILLFSFLSLVDFFRSKCLYDAFIIQFIIESNPFYSDFTIMAITKNQLHWSDKQQSYPDTYKEQFLNYQFTYKWYIHFTVWVSLIILFMKINVLL